MKRKALPPTEPVIDMELLENAKGAVASDVTKRAVKCAVCGAVTAPISNEALCWVCRRLKISAWRDSDQQTAQE